MKKRKVISLVLIMVMAVTCFMTGCGGDDGETSAEGKVFRTYLSADTPSLNAHTQVDLYLDDVFTYVHSTLWKKIPAEDGTSYEWIGDLAADLPKQIDKHTWEVKVREDAKWHNGEQITADDFIYSWQMLIDPNLVNSMANFFWYTIDIENAEKYFNGECKWEDVGIKKVDDMTFQIITESEAVLEDVMENFANRALYPVYKENYEAGMNEDRTKTSYGTKLEDFVGAGPYTFETWTPDSVHVYKKNPDHHLADLYNYDTVELYIVGEDNARMQMFDSGELDYYSPSSDTIDAYIDDPRLLSYGSVELEHIDINCKNKTNPIGSSVNYRKAIYHALNREVIADKCFGHFEPAGFYVNNQAGLLSEDGIAYRETKYGKAVTDLIESWGPAGFNEEMAREYLDKAYKECNVSEDEVITLKLVFDSSDKAWKKTAEYIQEEWPKIFDGKIKVEIKNFSGISTTEYKAGNDDGWDLSPNCWSRGLSRNYPYTCFYYYLSSYDGAPNNYFSERFDKQYEVCENTKDYQKQLVETQKLEEIYLEDVIQVPVAQYTNYVLYADRVQIPMKQYVPGFGWGAAFGDIVE